MQCQNTPDPLQPHEIPTAPWKKLGTDLFQIEDKHYLVVANYFVEIPIRKADSHPSDEQCSSL